MLNVSEIKDFCGRNDLFCSSLDFGWKIGHLRLCGPRFQNLFKCGSRCEHNCPPLFETLSCSSNILIWLMKFLRIFTLCIGSLQNYIIKNCLVLHQGWAITVYVHTESRIWKFWSRGPHDRRRCLICHPKSSEEQKKVITSADVRFLTENQVKSKKKIITSSRSP